MCQFVKKSAGSNFGKDSAATSQAVNMEDNTHQYVVQVSDVSASYATYTEEGDEVLYIAPLSNTDDYNSPVTHEFYIIPTKRVRIEIEYLDNNDVINLSGFGIYLGIGDLVLTQHGNSPMIVHLPDEQYIQLDNIITSNIDSSNFIFSDTYTSPSYAPTAIEQKSTSSTAGIQIVPMTGMSSLVAIAVAISFAATFCGWLLAFAYLYRVRAARKKVSSSLTSVLPVSEQHSSSDCRSLEKTERAGSGHHTINCVNNGYVDSAAHMDPSDTNHYLLSAEANAVDDRDGSKAAHCDEAASCALHSIAAHTNATATASSGYQNHYSNFHIDAQHINGARVDEAGDSALQRSPSQYSMHSSNPDSIVFADEQDGSIYSDSEHGHAAV